MPAKNLPQRRAFYLKISRQLNNEAPSINQSLTHKSWTNSASSIDNPSWRTAVSRHLGATTARAGQLHTVGTGTSGYAYVRFQSNPPSPSVGSVLEQVVGDIAGPFQTCPSTFYTDLNLRAKVSNRALMKFYNNAWSALNRFDGGVFLGEVRETLNMLKRPGKSIRKLIDTYYQDAVKRARKFYRTGRRIDPVRVKDANKVLLDTWLEYSFGLRPLLSDAKSAAEALASLALDPNEFESVFAYDEEYRDISPADLATFDSVRSFSPTFIIYDFTLKARVGYQCRIIGQVRVAVDNPLLMKRETLGFSPEQFVPTVYNVIPYTWLVDYFSNLGDVINAWSFPVSRLSWHNRTIRSLKEWEVAGVMRRPIVGGTAKLESWHGSPIHSVSKSVTFERDGDALGLPSLVLEIPGWSTKWMNVAALAGMRFL